MPMPNEIVFIRHGLSEANVIHKLDKSGEAPHEKAQEIQDRPDWQQRLSARGVEQAKAAGEWVEKNLGGIASFDALYVSPFLRTRETAAHIAGVADVEWTVDDRIAERSWGVYGTVAKAEQRALYPKTALLQELTPWYVRFDGGESMPDVYGRFRDFQGTLHREQDSRKVMVVSHGDFMNVARYGIERMLPEQWEAMDRDSRYTIRNCSVIHYSRVNPEDPHDVRDKISWRRMIYTDSPETSPDGGAWVELPGRQRFRGTDLLKQVEMAPKIIEE